MSELETYIAKSTDDASTGFKTRMDIHTSESRAIFSRYKVSYVTIRYDKLIFYDKKRLILHNMF